MWRYENALYPALMWYWREISWESGQNKEMSWAEVALDFQAATHTGLAREGQEWDSETLRARAKIMAASSGRLACLCREDIASGGKEALNALVGTLQGLGFARARGMQARPVLMKRSFVQQVLLQEAVKAATRNTDPTLDFVPDMAGVGEPTWTHEETLDPETNEKRKGNYKLNQRQVRQKTKLNCR